MTRSTVAAGVARGLECRAFDGRTRLDGDTLTDVASDLGLPLSTSLDHPARAERQLVEAISRGELH